MNTLQALFHGRLEPQAICPEYQHPIKKQSDSVTSYEKLLSAHLSEHDIILLQQYSDAWSNLNAITNENSFVAGFRLGTQLSFDACANREHIIQQQNMI